MTVEIRNPQAEPRSCFVPLYQAAGILGCTLRHARRELAGVPADLIRYDQRPGRGRPMKLYHVSAHPALQRHADKVSAHSLVPGDAPRSTLHAPRASAAPRASDLALAELRSEAVRLYSELRRRMPEAEAAAQVCAAYQAEPKSRHIYIGERLAENNLRRRDQTVTLSKFSPGALRQWYAAWSGVRPPSSGVCPPVSGVRPPAGGLLALVPARHGRCGRRRAEIPDALLNIVHAWAVKNPRADLRKALRAARREWPGDWPNLSYATWLRRLRERDPAKFTATLGKQGISAFRKRHSPDIERDYSDMAYNAEWQLDDVTLDFYGLDWSLQRLIRPFAYAVIRVATRQWMSVVTTETPIVKAQVKALLGLALADPIGGIPERIRFERGAVACDAATEELLRSLGIDVRRTSMDGGSRNADAFPDRAIGHAAGKGIIERANRSLHNQPGMWDQPLQVGTMERTTASQNLEVIKAVILANAKAGKIIPRFAPAQWQAAVAQAMVFYNAQPHGRLPEVVDAETSTPEKIRYRHMSPDEYAATLQPDLRVMDPSLLPLFFAQGSLIEVGKNGFTLNNFSYGRFDEDLQVLAGTKVTVFQLADCPRVAYVAELGRCVEAWRMPKAGEEGGLVEAKRGLEQGKRNKYEVLMAEVLAAGSQAVLDQTRLLANPLMPAPRVVETVRPPALAASADRMAAATTSFRARQKASDDRFDMSGARGRPGSAKPRPAGLLEKSLEYARHVAVLSDDKPADLVEDKFAVPSL